MKLELTENWGIFYHPDIGWYPYCRHHEKVPEKSDDWIFISSCDCPTPESIWSRVFFMDQLEKFK